MDKTKELETSFNHAISITERKSIIISGVKRIDSFDNEEFLMETTLGSTAASWRKSRKGFMLSKG